MLKLIQYLVQSWDESNVIYCHWKSNFHLQYAVAGKEDLDVLIRKMDYTKCLEVLGRIGFKRVISISDDIHTGLEHFYGFDEDSGRLVHLHLYYRVVTGDSLVKNYRLPVDTLLLENRRNDCGIYTPSREAELILFIIRMMLKQSSPVELRLFERDYERTQNEARWLFENSSIDDLKLIARNHLPFLPAELLFEALSLLQNRSSRLNRVLCGRKFANCLAAYRRFNAPVKLYFTLRQTLTLISNRLLKRKGAMKLSTGGVVIALVGPQATGKSTTLAAIRKNLGSEFRVKSAHVGKPPSTLVTAAPNMMLPIARLILPRKRSSYIETKGSTASNYSLIHLLRIVCLAVDRRSLILSMHRAASKGEIVIADRYVSLAPKAIDSQHFNDDEIQNQTSALKRWLMRREAGIYASIPAPDLVIALTVPVEIAIERDQKRDKNGPKDPEYVRQRHAMSVSPRFSCQTEFISTLEDVTETQRRVMKLIWKAL